MREIPLTQGQVALVDDEDFRRFGHLKWSASRDRKKARFYAKRTIRKTEDGVGRKSVYLHRAILGVTDPRVKVDHKNHNGLDNIRKNLRACTNAQNTANRSSIDARNTSGFRGVSWHKKVKMWCASIKVKGRKLHIGYFKNKNKAAMAYIENNRKHFGEFGGHTR